jgi:hypothetical protein
MNDAAVKGDIMKDVRTGSRPDQAVVEHGMIGSDPARDVLADHFPLAKRVAAARHEAAVMPDDVGQRAEAVGSQFEQPVRRIEQLR